MISNKEVKELLDRYFEGNTSCKEEQLLRRFFTSEHVPEDLSVYKPIFVCLNEDSLRATAKQKTHQRKRFFIHLAEGAIAASILITLGIAGYNSFTRQDTDYVIINGEKSTDIRLAKQQASKTFADVSFSEEEVADDIIPKDMKESPE
jgi:hypothetical protein